MSFKDLIPWRRGTEVPVQRQGEPFGDAFGDVFGLAPFFRDPRSLFDRFFEGFGDMGGFGGALGPTPALELTEKGDAYRLSVELPGVDESDVELSIRDGALSLCGEKRAEVEQEQGGVHRTERRYGRFERTLPLPADVDEERVEARFTRGVLHVTLPKRPDSQTRSRRIPVRSVRD